MVTVAVSGFAASPTVISRVLGLTSTLVTVGTAGGAASTLTIQSADFAGSAVEAAVTVAFPALLAVTTPSFTSTTAEPEVTDQVTFEFSVPSDMKTVAVSRSVPPPTVISRVSGVTSTLSTVGAAGGSAGTTVTVQDADCVGSAVEVAVMVVDPSFEPVSVMEIPSFPNSPETTVASSAVHLTLVSVVVSPTSKFTVAVSCTLSFTFNVSELSLNCTPVTAAPAAGTRETARTSARSSAPARRENLDLMNIYTPFPVFQRAGGRAVPPALLRGFVVYLPSQPLGMPDTV